MNENMVVNATKDDLLLLLKETYNSAVFGHIDLCDNTCQELLNSFLNKKLKDSSFDCSLKVGLGVTKTGSLGYLYENPNYDWSSNFFSVTTS